MVLGAAVGIEVLTAQLCRFQILQALKGKVAMSDSVDLSLIARDTEGYSGADLQAIVYNAHLEVVHQTITAQEEKATLDSTRVNDDENVDFTTFGGAAGRAVTSKAEEAVLKRRVSKRKLHRTIIQVLIIYLSLK